MEVPNCVPLKCPYTTGKPSQVQTLLLRLGGGRGWGRGGGRGWGCWGEVSAECQAAPSVFGTESPSERNAAPENSP